MKNTTKRTELPRFHIGVVAIISALFILFLFLANLVKKGDPIKIDTVLRNIFVLEEQSFLFTIFKGIAWFGSTTGIITLLFIMVVLLIWKYRDYKGAIVFVVMVMLTNFLSKALKALFQRERPIIPLDELDYSFPSSGAFISLVAYGLATYLLTRNRTKLKEKYLISIVGVTLIILIGISRVALSAHYPTDVIAGHTLGAIFLILSIYLYRWWLKTN
ncbi:phosphatase PAP2 family protein [Bacillus spongiae]|uniref:Phosphatase PAP2 family protein n=1 Tax=Bacillus spongiae TaxID=2683610 RepID=A0ABU8H8L5_9BACI